MSGYKFRTSAVAGFLAAFCIATPAAAIAGTNEPIATADARLARSLMRLERGQRFQQMCDVAAMKAISRDSRPGKRGASGGSTKARKPLRPDRATLDAISPVKERGDTLRGDGAAVRSNGKWLRLSFTCVASPDRLTVLRFNYKLGDEIPEAQWERYGLWR